MTKSRILSGQTLIPIGSLVVIVGGVLWASNVAHVAHAAHRKSDEVEKKHEADKDIVAGKLDDVGQRVSKIEGQVQIIYDILTKEPRR